MSEIGELIREKRKHRNMSMKELADKVSDILGKSISANMVSYWENGQRRIYADQLQAICQALLVSPNHLMPDYLVERDDAIIEFYLSLPKEEREIMQYCANKWTGNARALVYFMGLYMGLDAEYRKDLAEYGLWKYEKAVESGHTNIESPPVAYEYIKKQAEKIGK